MEVLSGSCLDLIWVAGHDLVWSGSVSRWDEDRELRFGRDPDQISRARGGVYLDRIAIWSRPGIAILILCGFH